MATILRADWRNYQPRYDKVPLAEVAAKDRKFPAHWISECGTDVTDEFLTYARPLIGDNWVSVPLIDGRLRLARLDTSKSMFADQKLSQYVPQADRKG
jgi:6-phosphofructokinase 1